MISKEMQSSRFKLDADMAMAEMYPKSGSAATTKPFNYMQVGIIKLLNKIKFS